ncbi:MAG: N-formylglutamate amidohydrolase [Kangiellaceae bacterium]|nr:N-formylglutamate amidohydrolase [Kangiellaceae bacterium]
MLTDQKLNAELDKMTDAYTDELFFHKGSTRVIFPLSRLLVDVERFPDDHSEPMAKVGMGMIYTRTSDGKPLKRKLTPEEIDRYRQYYDNHHDSLDAAVAQELKNKEALIIDCHSFPDQPLKCDTSQSTNRPDICVGTDPFHTSAELVNIAQETFGEMGYDVRINAPYAGTIVPLKYYKQEPRVKSMMIEVNRKLYMDELTGEKARDLQKSSRIWTFFLLRLKWSNKTGLFFR